MIAASERVGRRLAVRGVVRRSLLIAALVRPAVLLERLLHDHDVTAGIVLVLNISWNFVLGMAGVWNFGQLAIYALGGYGAGLLMLHTPGAEAVSRTPRRWAFSAAISVLLAFPTLRLYGIYTSLLTFSFAWWCSSSS